MNPSKRSPLFHHLSTFKALDFDNSDDSDDSNDNDEGNAYSQGDHKEDTRQSGPRISKRPRSPRAVISREERTKSRFDGDDDTEYPGTPEVNRHGLHRQATPVKPGVDRARKVNRWKNRVLDALLLIQSNTLMTTLFPHGLRCTCVHETITATSAQRVYHLHKDDVSCYLKVSSNRSHIEKEVEMLRHVHTYDNAALIFPRVMHNGQVEVEEKTEFYFVITNDLASAGEKKRVTPEVMNEIQWQLYQEYHTVYPDVNGGNIFTVDGKNCVIDFEHAFMYYRHLDKPALFKKCKQLKGGFDANGGHYDEYSSILQRLLFPIDDFGSDSS